MDETSDHHSDPAARQLRYGEFLGMVRVKQRTMSYNDVFAADRARARLSRLRLIDVHRLLTPYVGTRFIEQARAVVPLAVFLAVFLTVALRTEVAGNDRVAWGICAVIVGLMFFMEGVKYGLMPFAENIGFSLPNRAAPVVVLGFAFLLGAIATFAEPAIGALRVAGGNVDATVAPVLHLLLNTYPQRLVFAVGGGVGLAVALGMLRFFFGWPMKRLVILTLLPCLAATLYVGLDPRLAPVLGLAWDCGAITTGPVTVPLVLALGIGVAAAAGEQDNPLAGFGIVTLASLFPALAVIGVAVDLAAAPVAGLLVPAAPVAVATGGWWDASPFAELLAALRAIAPLVLLLWLVQRFLLGEPLRHGNVILYGIVTALLGITLFNLGLSLGLAPLGDQAGGMAPAAFSSRAGQPALYHYLFGLTLVLLFAAALGFGATVAEPALNALGATVEDLTDGAFPKRLLIRTVAFGVAGGVALGIARIIFQWPMLPLLLGGYAVALAATLLSSEEYVSLAWDSAGVTTGPVTVPLVLALGLGLGEAVGAAEGFGILSMASVGPIVSVLLVGLWIKRRAALRAQEIA
jgi:hypothetical protein